MGAVVMIGAAHPAEIPDVFRPFVGLRDRDEIDRILAAGIPRQLAEYCAFWPGAMGSEPDPDAVIVLSVGGHRGPARELDELLAVLAGHDAIQGLRLQLQPDFDLSDLAEVWPRLRHVGIEGAGLRGWDALDGATALRSCNILADPDVPLRLRNATALEYAYVVGENGARVADHPSLRRLLLAADRWPTGLTCGRSLQSLEVTLGLTSLTTFPSFDDPTSIVEIKIEKVPQLDLAELRSLTSLRSLTVGRVREVHHAEALLEMPSLTDLYLGGVWSMTGRESLEHLRLNSLALPRQRLMSAKAAEALERRATGQPM